MILNYADGYFGTARERYEIKLRREAGKPFPWTNDPQFRTWRFCNVHREDDKTTVWFREHIRKYLTGLKALEATVAFRWFNRIETGQLIADLLIGDWNAKEAEQRLEGVTPVVTGAYIIKGYDGYPKLQGVLKAIEEARPQLPIFYQSWIQPSGQQLHTDGTVSPPIPLLTLEGMWRDLKTVNYLGGFMAYEVVSDLRWCKPFDESTDIMTWANAGPGCARGLGWATEGHPNAFTTGPGDQKRMLPLMRELLDMSRDTQYWPAEWPRWEMREVEHWSCEFDKFCRARTGEKMKRRFRAA